MEAHKELKYIFANINEWLKFAEAKHGGLIVLNAGIIIGILSSLSNLQNCTFKPSLIVGMICFGVSIFLSLLSQFPVTQNFFTNIRNVPNPNLYFFGHLCHLDVVVFTREFLQIDPNFAATKFDLDLINQILVNARIANAKYTIFKAGSFISVLGLGIIGLCSLIKVLWHY